jgi:RNA polymerase sigma-70 factor (ECF subfamily)
MNHLSDTELMELVKQGDFAAFDELYNRYQELVRRFLFSLTWDQEIAEDYLQEVFLRLYRARESYEPTGKFRTYILQIAKNYYLTQRKKSARRAGEVSLAQEQKDGFKPYENIRASERVEPEIHLLEEYRRWKVRQAISLLPEAQKLVFVMSHFENMKYTEIAEILAVPVGTVKSRMFGAVRTLRTLLKEEQE